MWYRRWNTNPWAELEHIQDELNRVFNHSFGTLREDVLSPAFPAFNVWTGKDDVKVVVALPGMDPKDIDISVLGNTVTISGERRPETPDTGALYHRRERTHGKFIRTVELPVNVDRDKIEARYVDGVLSVTLPRVEEQKPKQIAVKVA
jgi:HSP20 family protein